jgi:hypothetical protein
VVESQAGEGQRKHHFVPVEAVGAIAYVQRLRSCLRLGAQGTAEAYPLDLELEGRRHRHQRSECARGVGQPHMDHQRAAKRAQAIVIDLFARHIKILREKSDRQEKEPDLL